MDKEIRDIYERIGNKYNRYLNICKHFNGDINNKKHIDRCEKHCDYYDFKEMMEEGQVFRRAKVTLRKNRRIILFCIEYIIYERG